MHTRRVFALVVIQQIHDACSPFQQLRLKVGEIRLNDYLFRVRLRHAMQIVVGPLLFVLKRRLSLAQAFGKRVFREPARRLANEVVARRQRETFLELCCVSSRVCLIPPSFSRSDQPHGRMGGLALRGWTVDDALNEKRNRLTRRRTRSRA